MGKGRDVRGWGFVAAGVAGLEAAGMVAAVAVALAAAGEAAPAAKVEPPSGTAANASPATIPPFDDLVKIFDYDAKAPLDLQEIAVHGIDGARIRDVTYPSPKGGRVPGYLVEPTGPGPHAGIVFVHLGAGNRSSFLSEALLLARAGAVSLLIDAPYIRPSPWRRPGGDFAHPQDDRDMYVQLVVDVRRGYDVLVSRPGVDPKRLGYVGHSLGATWGGVLAGVERRVKAFVLMAGLPSLSEDSRRSSHPYFEEMLKNTPADVLDKYTETMAPLDAVHYVGHAAPASILFQWARFDMWIPEESARKYEAAATGPKSSRWYDSGHELNDPAALADRLEWLRAQLGLRDVASILRARVAGDRGSAARSGSR